MKLTLNGIKEHEAWENAGIQLPGYDVEKISAKAKEAPVWEHFGAFTAISSVYLSVVLQTDFWKREFWTEESPVWRPLTMM